MSNEKKRAVIALLFFAGLFLLSGGYHGALHADWSTAGWWGGSGAVAWGVGAWLYSRLRRELDQ